ncbi:class I SAM-dependent methyltransferase [Alteromonas flava]|uniref:class I SAM-dependent methyltransferase n=1 Tax=Alteromonas flava TaxID=2048003 RepID=UPI000C286A0F|nr:class I SAM-dependent methyltransferase [Alteromonas flava]
MENGTGQLLLRNDQLFSDGQWVLFNPDESEIFAALPARVDGFHQYFDSYQAALEKGGKQTFAAQFTLESSPAYDGAVIYLPTAKAHASMLIENARSVVKAGGTIAIVGSNDSGIKSIGKRLKQSFGEVQKYDAARHCAIWLVTNPAQIEFNLNDYIKVSTYSSNAIQWKVASLPGVFSADGLDPGTELLLSSIPELKGSSCLDFACGAGVIGCYLNLRQPHLTVKYSDINALSLYCCKKSLELNDLHGEVIASNGLNEWQERFDNIITNPPFHSGKQTNYGITERFIATANSHLQVGGQLYLVANRFLPYPDLIDQHLRRQADVAKSGKFTVYKASKK